MEPVPATGHFGPVPVDLSFFPIFLIMKIFKFSVDLHRVLHKMPKDQFVETEYIGCDYIEKKFATAQVNKSDNLIYRIASDPTIRCNPIGFLVTESVTDPTARIPMHFRRYPTVGIVKYFPLLDLNRISLDFIGLH